MNSLRRALSAALPILVFVPAVLAQPAQCPSPAPSSPPVTISPQLPADVCLPPGDVPGIAYFDDFSWRSFVALVWPAMPGSDGRGKPNPNRKPGDPDALPVFEGYKADWEVFQPEGREPSEWFSYDVTKSPCGPSTAGTGSLQLAAFSKFGNVRLATFVGFGGPLISQNGQYTRFLAAFNEVAFDNIRREQWYLQKKLTNVTFNPDAQGNNPIVIKTSWVLITKGMDASRFYTSVGHVRNTVTDQCSVERVGLVGLHIVTKTPSRPQWIWSTFEQVDNVPAPGDAKNKNYTYNNGNPKDTMPDTNPIHELTDVPCGSLPKEKCPFNVTRSHTIAESTSKTNKRYQEKLGGVWQYYQLVMTQWPTPGTPPAELDMDGTPNHTIPGTSVTPAPPVTPFANVTMETFDQEHVRTGCMACHNAAASDLTGKTTDFIWALPLNAFPAQVGTASVADAHAKITAQPPSGAVKRLIEILAQGERDMAAARKTAQPPVKKTAKPKK